MLKARNPNGEFRFNKKLPKYIDDNNDSHISGTMESIMYYMAPGERKIKSSPRDIKVKKESFYKLLNAKKSDGSYMFGASHIGAILSQIYSKNAYLLDDVIQKIDPTPNETTSEKNYREIFTLFYFTACNEEKIKQASELLKRDDLSLPQIIKTLVQD